MSEKKTPSRSLIHPTNLYMRQVLRFLNHDKKDQHSNYIIVLNCYYTTVKSYYGPLLLVPTHINVIYIWHRPPCPYFYLKSLCHHKTIDWPPEGVTSFTDGPLLHLRMVCKKSPIILKSVVFSSMFHRRWKREKKRECVWVSEWVFYKEKNRTNNRKRKRGR